MEGDNEDAPTERFNRKATTRKSGKSNIVDDTDGENED